MSNFLGAYQFQTVPFFIDLYIAQMRIERLCYRADCNQDDIEIAHYRSKSSFAKLQNKRK